MNIIPSAEIRQNYGDVAKLCKNSCEPVYLTNRGKGELVVMDIDAFNRREESIKLRERLLAVEEARLAGDKGLTCDEFEKRLDEVIEKAVSENKCKDDKSAI